MIEKHLICRDERWYLAWPDIVLMPSGKLLCIFSECTHHSDRSYTRVMLCHSDDRGRSWSEKRPLTEGTGGLGYFYNCARLSLLRDGRVVAICDRISGTVSGELASDTKREILLWFSEDEGNTWSQPVLTPVEGFVPDKLLELESGRWILSAQTPAADDSLQQRLWFSDDQGGHWQGPVTVAHRRDLKLCEGSILPLDGTTLVAFLRENSFRGLPCYKTISRDAGETWSEPVEFPLPGCHRPVAGMLSDGRILITHRFCQAG